ncbi:hypothetical protein pEaSNUABM22_00168 [Erwinia phage pEa_SNUABM_22]|uniref:Uncharacterized protein n=1 Tax=Erwinia phage pEa_SNUABM_22 TaxID=2869549 RepID=A0AAE9BU00_9CAUD|nr:hypothetical protein MPK63_gp167 [Erwinia phage pEa_SNUABM_22]UAW96655.1 hypothetical protein pEaSNUABM22_00168 [Erwinia phage pEa_SNUABM_22]
MEFRTEYNLTLSQSAGRLLVKALVEYHETVMGSAFKPGVLPTVFEVPGVLRIDNLVIIEDHSYSQVLNPIHKIEAQLAVRQDHLRQYAPKYEPRRAAESEEHALNVKFVVWQRLQNL